MPIGLAALSAYLLYRRNPPRRPEVFRTPRPDGSAGTPDAVFAADCKEFERLVNENPRDFSAWSGWGLALHQLAVRKSGAEADGIYAEADEKYSAALALRPDDLPLASHLVRLLYHRGERNGGEAERQCIIRACDLAERIVEQNPVEIGRRAHPSYYQLLSAWSSVLYLRTERMPGEETRRLVTEAVRRLEEAARAGADSGVIALGWGSLLFAQARAAEGPEAVALFKAAGEKFLESELRAPGAGAYNLACVAARLGNLDECRSWIMKSRQSGARINWEWTARDPDLAGVRECDWFRELVAK